MGCFGPDQPAPQNIGQQTRDTLQAQIDLAPKQLAAAQQVQPGYTALDIQTLGQLLQGQNGQGGLLDLYGKVAPQLQQLQADSTRANLASNISNVQQLAPQASAALAAANPQQKALVDALNSSAMQGLAAGTQLLPQDAANISKSVNSSWANRGLGGTNANQLGLAMQLYGGGQQALAQRQQFGTQMTGVNQQVVGNPMLALLGQQGTGLQNALGTVGQANQNATTIGGGVQSMFNPFNSYASNLYNQNQNVQWQYNQSQPSTMGVIGQIGSTVGSVAGGLLGAI